MKRNLCLLSAAACVCLTVILLLVTGVAQAFPQKRQSPAASNKSWTYDELAKAPPKQQARQNPLEHDPDSLAAGSKLFENHCAECHGSAADGTKDAPSLRAAEVQQATPGALFWLVTNGVVRRGMPVWSKLPEPQRWQIVVYLKSLGASASAGKQVGSLPHPRRRHSEAAIVRTEEITHSQALTR